MSFHPILSCRSPYQKILLFVLLFSLTGLFASDAFSKTLYSYSDESGTRVITDNYNNIPPIYRSRATAVEQDEGFMTGLGATSGLDKLMGSKQGFVIDVPGMSFQQSKVITYAGMIALVCIVAMNLSRSEAIRVLALWCLLMTGICAPVLVYIADDGAGTIMKKKATEIQQKQKERLSEAQ